MAALPLLSFRSDAKLAALPDEQVKVYSALAGVLLNRVTPGLREALERLQAGAATEDELCAIVAEKDGTQSVRVLRYWLQRLGSLGLLTYSVTVADRLLATVVPMARGFQFANAEISPVARFRLSRFVYCHRQGDSLVAESPLAVVRVLLSGQEGARILADLTRPQASADLCAHVAGLTDPAARTLLSLLLAAGMIGEAPDNGLIPEDTDPVLAQWEFHDLLFHARSRMGRHDNPVGGTFRFLGQIPPLPAVKPAYSEQPIPLYRPDLERLRQADVPFTQVLESRRSIRAFGDPPITARQLGEFLYRSARVRSIREADPQRSRDYEWSSRPYPSGGATYDLEVYLTIATCAGIVPGLYHYDPVQHQLHRLADAHKHAATLLRDAQHAAALLQPPQVLITLASRFQRVSWKYESIAYALTLKNAGVLQQTMYLVATAMGLAACALGTGDSALFAAVIGTDYFAESSVGEFLLGSPPGA